MLSKTVAVDVFAAGTDSAVRDVGSPTQTERRQSRRSSSAELCHTLRAKQEIPPHHFKDLGILPVCLTGRCGLTHHTRGNGLVPES